MSNLTVRNHYAFRIRQPTRASAHVQNVIGLDRECIDLALIACFKNTMSTPTPTRFPPGGGGDAVVEDDDVDTKHKGTRLVQSRVPNELYERIRRCASHELLPVSAYIRRTLQNHVPGG